MLKFNLFFIIEIKKIIEDTQIVIRYSLFRTINYHTYFSFIR